MHFQRQIKCGSVSSQEWPASAAGDDDNAAFFDVAESSAEGVLIDKLIDLDGRERASWQFGVVEDVSQRDGVHQRGEHTDIVGRDGLDAVADDLVAANVVAAADHDDDFGAVRERWFDLISDPASAVRVEAARELAL